MKLERWLKEYFRIFKIKEWNIEENVIYGYLLDELNRKLKSKKWKLTGVDNK